MKKIGTINSNPKFKDCIGWEDEKGNMVYREDFELTEYSKYVKSCPSDKPLPQDIWVKDILWNRRGTIVSDFGGF